MEYSTVVAQIEVPAGVEQAAAGRLYEALQGVPDGRAKRGRRYEAAVVVTILLLAKLAGERSLSGIAQWARLRGTWLREQVPLKGDGLPCANTYRYVCEQLDVAELNTALANCWLVPDDARRTPSSGGWQTPARHAA